MGWFRRSNPFEGWTDCHSAPPSVARMMEVRDTLRVPQNLWRDWTGSADPGWGPAEKAVRALRKAGLTTATAITPWKIEV